MSQTVVLELTQKGLWLLLQLAAPTLILSLIVGLAISVFQAVTQINEATLSFLPKLLAVLIALAVAGPWMISMLVNWIRQVITSIPNAVG